MYTLCSPLEMDQWNIGSGSQSSKYNMIIYHFVFNNLYKFLNEFLYRFPLIFQLNIILNHLGDIV